MLLSGLGAYRRAPPASSRPFLYTMEPPDIFEAVIYMRWPCRTPSSLAVGYVFVEIKRRSSRAGYYHRVDNLRARILNCAACSSWEKNKQIFFSFFPTAAVRGTVQMFFESNTRYVIFGLRVSIGIGLKWPQVILEYETQLRLLPSTRVDLLCHDSGALAPDLESYSLTLRVRYSKTNEDSGMGRF